MDDTFDPYLKWLGIRSPERPPNHYALLGLSLFEDDPEVVSNAADRQMSHVRTYQVGPHSQWSQRLLNELAAAKLCLLRADRKAAYDAQLGEQLAAAEADTVAQAAAAVPVAEYFVREQMPVATPVATPVDLPFQTHYIEPPADYAPPPQAPAPAPWQTPAAEPPLAAPPAGSLDFSERFAMPASEQSMNPGANYPGAEDPYSAGPAVGPTVHNAAGDLTAHVQDSGTLEYASPAIQTYAENVGWTAPVAYEPPYAVSPPGYGAATFEPDGAPGAVGAATPHDIAVFAAARPTSASARMRTHRRRSSPIGIYVVLAGLVLVAVILGTVVSEQRRAYDQEVAAQRAQEAARRAATVAPPASRWKRPPNRDRAVDARLPRPSSPHPSHEDRVPLGDQRQVDRALDAGEPASFEDPLLQEADRGSHEP